VIRLTRRMLPGLAMVPALARAQGPWPTGPVRLIVGFAAGGPIDAMARLIAERMAPRWAQPIVVENRSGASGTLAANHVVRSPADGHTILIGSAAETVVATLTQRSLPYDPHQDLQPLTLITRNPFLLAVTSSVPARTLPEVLAYGRGRQLIYGSAGVGTATHFGSELFNQRTGLELVHAPYRGSAAMFADLIAGRIHMSLDAVPALLPLVRAGQLHPIGVATLSRSVLAPEIPTLSEQGLDGFIAGGWVGAFVPRQTPRAVAERIEQDFRGILRQGVAAELQQRGFETQDMSSSEFAAFTLSERARWTEVAQRAGIEPS
jgi:tripartite-type tricarboxylate transporter receptor subunit TctC